MKKDFTLKKALLVTAAAIMAFVLITGSITVISEGRVGVKYRFGKIVETGMEPGMHFHLPFVETVKKIDVTEQVYIADVSAYTKDTQTVRSLDIQLNYYYNRSELDNLIRTIGIHNVEDKLVAPNIISVLKNEVGKYKAEELIANRSLLEQATQEEISKILNKYGITVSKISIQDIEFNEAFEQVVEQKVAAEQKAMTVQNETVQKEEEAKQKVIAAQAEAEATLIKAEAEAKANKLLNESLSPNLISYYKIQAWDGEFPEVMGNNVNSFVTLGD
ncbi:MAG: hypothetical protein IJJ48_01700 [Firmicutes bacterium]|nr:hypothetical protein [Bacillota bacterium]